VRVLHTIVASLLLCSSSAQAEDEWLCAAALEAGYRSGQGQSVYSPSELRASAAIPKGTASADLTGVLTALKGQGIHVVGAPWPDRPLVEPAAVRLQPGDEWTADVAGAAYAGLLELFSVHGSSVDLLAVARANPGFYNVRDPHMTVDGMQVAAQAMARTLLLDPRSAELPSANFVRRRGSSHEAKNVGNAVGRLCGKTPLPETYQTPLVAEKGGANELFGDVPPRDVVVLGSSQSDLNMNLGGVIQQELASPAHVVAVTAGGPLSSLFKYLDSEQWQNHTPKFIVWEFPVWSMANGVPKHSPSWQDPLSYRMLLPRIERMCDRPPKELGRFENLETDTRVVLVGAHNNAMSTMPRNGSLRLQFERPTVDSYTIRIVYQDDTVELVRVDPWSRLGPQHTAHLLFDPSTGTVPRSIVVEFQDSVPRSMTASICLRPR